MVDFKWLNGAFGLDDDPPPDDAESTPESELQYMSVPVCNPSGAPGDFGETVDCWFRVRGRTVIMCNSSGEASGKVHRLAPNENARQVAARLAKSKWRIARDGDGPSGFGRPLYYQRDGGVV